MHAMDLVRAKQTIDSIFLQTSFHSAIPVLQVVQVNQKGAKTRFSNWLGDMAPIASYLDSKAFPRKRRSLGTRL